MTLYFQESYWTEPGQRTFEVAIDGKTVLSGFDILAPGWGARAWFGSQAVHAVSDSPLGPYVDKGLPFTDNDGQGHDVTAAALPDGRSCLLVSETRPASIHLAPTLVSPPSGRSTRNGGSSRVPTGREQWRSVSR